MYHIVYVHMHVVVPVYTRVLVRTYVNMYHWYHGTMVRTRVYVRVHVCHLGRTTRDSHSGMAIIAVATELLRTTLREAVRASHDVPRHGHTHSHAQAHKKCAAPYGSLWRSVVSTCPANTHRTHDLPFTRRVLYR